MMYSKLSSSDSCVNDGAAHDAIPLVWSTDVAAGNTRCRLGEKRLRKRKDAAFSDDGVAKDETCRSEESWNGLSGDSGQVQTDELA